MERINGSYKSSVYFCVHLINVCKFKNSKIVLTYCIDRYIDLFYCIVNSYIIVLQIEVIRLLMLKLFDI